MITISLCMIVKNEEAVLRRCLESIRNAVDEIIIVDTGSGDNTESIAREFTENVFHFEWCDDFAAARNYAFERATMDYQMWLDADDVVPGSEREALIALKQSLDPSFDIVTMPYILSVDGGGRPTFTSVRERLIRRDLGLKWEGAVHECIPLTGRIFHSEIAIHHKKEHPGDPRRNLRIYEGIEKSGRSMTPRELYYFARELRDNGELQRAEDYFTRFLDGGQGWVEDNISSCLALSYIARSNGDLSSERKYLLRSFEYDSPRAEICCRLGYFYKALGDYNTAADWFHLALHLRRDHRMGFTNPDYSNYIPHIELCVCYYRLSDMERAHYHNEMALTFKPEDPAALSNRSLF